MSFSWIFCGTCTLQIQWPLLVRLLVCHCLGVHLLPRKAKEGRRYLKELANQSQDW